MNSDFLEKAKTSNSLISEQKILEYLADMKKAIVISLDKLEYFQECLVDIKRQIERASQSDIHYFELGENGIRSQSILGDRYINELEFHNLLDRKFNNSNFP